MFLDDLLKLADAQESTVSVASTSYIDTLAAGDSYEGAWFYARVDTAFTDGAGSPTATFSVQTGDAITCDTTLVSSTALLSASLTAGAEVKLRIPPGAKRYIRGYVTVADGTEAKRFSAGKWDMFIVKDVDMGGQQEA